LSVAGGRVDVAWTIRDGPTRLELTWTEPGGPKLPTRGFGTELIERGIRFELQGEAKLGAVDGGLYCRIVILANPQFITFGSPPDRPVREEAAS
jgi:two-component system, chemotaxis family, CheB/CheR fusion protein